MSIKSQLEEAFARGTIVRIYEDELEDGWIDGWVAALGDDFFAMEVFDKACRLNGYNCLRYSDVKKLSTPAPHATFLSSALAARGLSRTRIFEVDLSSTQALLESAGKAFPLVTIHCEEDFDACWIGKVTGVSEDEVQIRCIDPDAKLDSQLSTYKLAEIRQVDVGGGYEEALHLVAGTA